MMRLFFGSKKKEAPKVAVSDEASATHLPDAIQQNKAAIETLTKRQELLEQRISNEEEQARKRVAVGDKKGALMVLKRKKMLEQELDTLMNSRLTLEQQINTLEAAQMNHIAVKALAHGVNVHKKMNAAINADDVDQLMGDLEEQRELQNEIAQVLSSGAHADEDDLMRELEQMEARQQDEMLIGASNAPIGAVSAAAAVKAAGPAAASSAAPGSRAKAVSPKSKAPEITQEEEAELAALQQQMS